MERAPEPAPFLRNCRSLTAGFLVLTYKGTALGILIFVGIWTINVNGGCSTLAMFVVGAFLCFAVDLDPFASAVLFFCHIFGSLGIAVTEAAAAGFCRAVCLIAADFDFTSGAE